jgi:O-acetyl-ADP-ribose deacetylase (regulator of RNase III)
METINANTPTPPIHQPPLAGDEGVLIQTSPCGRYEIRRAAMHTFPSEAIVNATNRTISYNTAAATRGGQEHLRANAGPQLMLWKYENTKNYPSGLEIGDAVASPAFDLVNCHYVIHTNGPSYRTKHQSRLPRLKQGLADCYRRCLEEALKIGARSVAFPCISTGEVLGWPRGDAARIGIGTVKSWFNHPLFGKDRREQIPGPLHFLSDPMGSYGHQEEAWWTAFW